MSLTPDIDWYINWLKGEIEKYGLVYISDLKENVDYYYDAEYYKTESN